MYQSLLAALFLGMIPVPHVPLLSMSRVSLDTLIIAPPAHMIEVSAPLSASGVLIMDITSGQQLFARDAQVRRPMASLTKLMTAILIAEEHDLDELVTIPAKAESVEGNRAYLPAGEQFTIADVLSALLISSGNDAAYTLAVFHSGSVQNFVDEMNARAVSLGLKNTHFQNPMGLDSATQWSTPEDLAWLMSFALRSDVLKENIETRGKAIYSRDGERVYLTHTHALMHADEGGPNAQIPSDEPYILGGKTGTTIAAKECLISIVQYGDKEYLVILLHSDQRYSDMSRILSSLHKSIASL